MLHELNIDIGILGFDIPAMVSIATKNWEEQNWPMANQLARHDFKNLDPTWADSFGSAKFRLALKQAYLRAV